MPGDSILKAQIVSLQERRQACQRQARIAQASASLEDAADLLERVQELCPLVQTETQRRELLATMLNLQGIMSVLRRVARD